MQTKILDATEARANEISNLITKCSREQIGPTLTPSGLEHLLGDMTAEKIVERMNDSFRFILAEENSNLIGVAAIKPPSHLFYLFVNRNAQRRGIGRKLWHHIRDLVLEADNVEGITVNSSLNSVGAYESYGFVCEGRILDKFDVRYQPMRYRNPSIPDYRKADPPNDG